MAKPRQHGAVKLSGVFLRLHLTASTSLRCISIAAPTAAAWKPFTGRGTFHSAMMQSPMNYGQPITTISTPKIKPTVTV